MVQKGIYCVLALLVPCSSKGTAQTVKTDIALEGYQRAQLYKGDTITVISPREVLIYPQAKFKNKREQAKYNRLIRDVKCILPYAKMVYDTLIETYEYIEILPSGKTCQAHLKRVEKELFAQYKLELKKLSFSQGKPLIKPIDRGYSQFSYNLLKVYLESFRAGLWNLFAGMFGAGLRSGYDLKGKNAMTEWVVVLVENGLI